MTEDTVREILERWEQRKSARDQWENHWQELAEIMHPRRADFTTAPTRGDKRTDQQFDSVPMLAARGLAAAVEGLLTPKNERWFGLQSFQQGKPGVELDDAALRWIEDTEDRMWTAIYDPPARFVKAFSEAYLDLVTFGTAVVFMGERHDLSGLSFRTSHLKNAYIATNDEGEVDTIFLVEEFTAPQAERRFGDRALLGEETRQALEDNDRQTMFPFLQAVMPRKDRPRGIHAKRMPFAAISVDVRSRHLVSEGGYHEFPFAVMRWDTASGEDYGRSPGMLALPDAKTLMQMGKTLLEAGHKAVDPPWFAPSDSIASVPRTFPGGITYYDAEAMQGSGINRPIFPAISGANFPLAREMQNDVREQIWSAFFKNILNLPADGPQMTATEVMERKNEFTRTIGPTLARLEPDGPAAVTNRVFGIMQRAGQFQALPDSLRRLGVKMTHRSAIDRAIQQIEAAALMRSTELLAPFIQTDPTMMDHYDTDQIARDVPEAVGMPLKWLKPKEQVDELREKRIEAQAAAAQAQAASQALQQGLEAATKAPQLADAFGDQGGLGALLSQVQPQGGGNAPPGLEPGDNVDGDFEEDTDDGEAV